ncbi:hypothetical protein [Embleya sp. NPDC020886]|uniref:hypothetical protein n=1 Tax=Embleya sp. NPDC020886 TaxID=3363980 RepID=UPI003799CEB8
MGTRPWPMFAALLERAAATGSALDLDDARPDEVRADLADHVGARPADTLAYGAPRMCAIRKRLAHAVADRLAPDPERRAEWGAFLVAGIFTRHLARTPAPVDPDAAERPSGWVARRPRRRPRTSTSAWPPPAQPRRPRRPVRPGPRPQ